HILARIKGAKIEDVKSMLKADAPKHAEQGLILRHIWRNADDPEEILFIFTTPDLNRVRKSIEMMHAETLKENPMQISPKCCF
ncbi:MAG TPA: hypothetical protein VHF28_06940, partial [Nitrososphaera sp.]|nr:hypothetical protein [Nitrososphaera sp.]